MRYIKVYYLLSNSSTQQTQNLCITFVQRRHNIFDVGPHCTNVIEMFCVHWDRTTFSIGLRQIYLLILTYL